MSSCAQACWGHASASSRELPAQQQLLHASSAVPRSHQRCSRRCKPSALRWSPAAPRTGRSYGEAVGGSGSLVSLHMFGSFCSSLYHEESDLDLTITGQWRDRRGQLLDMVRRCVCCCSGKGHASCCALMQMVGPCSAASSPQASRA